MSVPWPTAQKFPRRSGAPRTLICVGHAAVDHHFEVDSFPHAPTKTPAHGYAMILGGMAANAAVAAARLGARVRLISRVGDDANGEFVCAALQAEGVDCTGVLRVAGHSTSVSSVIVDARGERQIYNHRGSAIARQPEALDTAQLSGAHAVLVDPRWPAGALAALQWARTHQVRSVLDADLAPAHVLASLTAAADWAVFSRGGLGVFHDHAFERLRHEPAQSLFAGSDAPTPRTDAQRLFEALTLALNAGATHAAVTNGAHGAYWLHPSAQTLQHHAALPVVAKDTTAAGDVFHAALAVALAHDQAVPEAMHFASVAAAIKCERGSGVLGAPDLASVLARMDNAA